MRWRLVCLGVCFAALLLAEPGCTGSGAVKVRGKVTLDGKPLGDATVIFIPVGKQGRQATAITESDGTFQLATFKPGDGALPGEYKITVQASQLPTEEEVPVMKPGQSSKEMWEAATQGAPTAGKKDPPKVVIPAKYSDASQTKLTCTVPVIGDVDLDLKSK